MFQENISSGEKMDELDQKILEIIQKNAKLGIKEVAAQIGLSTTPTYERIKRMERVGIIEGYFTKVNRRLQGLSLGVLCNVQLKSHASEYLEEFEQEIIKLPEIRSCFHIAGNFDYLLKIAVRDMDEYSYFVKDKLSKIPHISQVQSSFIMRTMKEEY